MNSEKASQITTNFTPPHPLKTAVLFVVFNRPDTTKQVFEAIRKAKPPRLYVAADGPRADKSGEAEKCEEVRQIATQVDWNCDVKTLFRDKNLGCRVGVSSAIDWFFENEEEGIILEDDCLPKPEFFKFCENGLKKYIGHRDIAGIGGFVALSNSVPFLSLHGSVWGWATWKDVWQQYDINATLDLKDIKFMLQSLPLISVLDKLVISEQLKITPVNTWDYYWLFSRIKLRKFFILPGAPLISNIGFDSENGTHTKLSKPKTILALEKIRLEKKNTNIESLITDRNLLSRLENKRMVGRFGKQGMAKKYLINGIRNPYLTLKAVILKIGLAGRV